MRKKNKITKDKLAMLYGLRCLLTNERDRLSVHHLEKVEYGGQNTTLNCAILNRLIHDWLHNDVELHDKALFELINDCLDLYKKCLDKKYYNLIEQYESECIPLFKERIKK